MNEINIELWDKTRREIDDYLKNHVVEYSGIIHDPNNYPLIIKYFMLKITELQDEINKLKKEVK